MPIYEYHCEKCGEEFEELLMSVAAEADVVCHSCGSGTVTRLMSGSAVRVSGGSGSVPNCPAYDPTGRSGCPGGGCSCH